MTAPGNDLLQAVLALAFVIASGYALGRIHQWYRDSARRERAYRNGYDLASNSMLDMAMSKRAAGETRPTAPAGELPRTSAVGDSRRRIRTGRSDYLSSSKAAH